MNGNTYKQQKAGIIEYSLLHYFIFHQGYIEISKRDRIGILSSRTLVEWFFYFKSRFLKGFFITKFYGINHVGLSFNSVMCKLRCQRNINTISTNRLIQNVICLFICFNPYVIVNYHTTQLCLFQCLNLWRYNHSLLIIF